jgi:hypothetical protein
LEKVTTFTEAIKLKWGHNGLDWILNPKTSAIIREREVWM